MAVVPTFPDIETGPLLVRSTLVQEDNSFAAGDLAAHVPVSGWILADNTVANAKATGIVISASPTEFRVVTSVGQIIPWANHGLGAIGQKLWLGTAGGYLTAAPGWGFTNQEVAEVYDADRLVATLRPVFVHDVVTAFHFGGKMNVLGRFAVANGVANTINSTSGTTTRQPVPSGGTLIFLAYNIESGNIETQVKIHLNGVVVATIPLNTVSFVNTGVVTIAVPIPVFPAQYMELEYDAGQSPDDSTFIVSQVGPP